MVALGRVVNSFDIARVAGAYGASQPDACYDSNCDLDDNEVIDIYDIAIAARNYSQSW